MAVQTKVVAKPPTKPEPLHFRVGDGMVVKVDGEEISLAACCAIPYLATGLGKNQRVYACSARPAQDWERPMGVEFVYHLNAMDNVVKLEFFGDVEVVKAGGA